MLTAIEQAARAGVENPSGLFFMTPVEIEWTLESFAARQRRENERMDALAWLTGRYAAVGWHAPRRYPKKPDGLRPAARPMTDDEMKRVFVHLATGGVAYERT